MPSYVTLINWTEQGVKNFKDTAKRADVAKTAAQRMGGDLTNVYWTLGPYDVIAVAEFPDDETATAYMLALGSEGNIRTTTLRAYDAAEIAQILAKTG